MLPCKGAFFQLRHQLVPKRVFPQTQLLFHHGPGKIPFHQTQGKLALSEVFHHIIDQHHHLLHKILRMALPHEFIGFPQDTGRNLIGKLLQQLILIVEIKVEGAFRHIGPPHDFIHRSFSHALLQKQPVGCVQQALLFLFFLQLNFFPHCPFLPSACFTFSISLEPPKAQGQTIRLLKMTNSQLSTRFFFVILNIDQ